MTDAQNTESKWWWVSDVVDFFGPLALLAGIVGGIIALTSSIDPKSYTEASLTGTVSDVRVVYESETGEAGHPLAGAVVGSALGPTGAIIGLASQSGPAGATETHLTGCRIEIQLASGEVVRKDYSYEPYTTSCALFRKGDAISLTRNITTHQRTGVQDIKDEINFPD